MKARDRFEERAALRMVRAAFRNLTGRDGAVLNYAMMSETPVGTLGIAAGPAGLCRVSFVKGEDDFLAELLEAFGEQPVVRSSRLDEARRALERYFSGRRLDFADLAVDLSELSPFERRVLGATARIPPGRVATYAEVARRAGNARASRAAGNALHKNPVAIVVPCHRVLRADGSLGGYGGGLPIKEWLLKHEGARG